MVEVGQEKAEDEAGFHLPEEEVDIHPLEGEEKEGEEGEAVVEVEEEVLLEGVVAQVEAEEVQVEDVGEVGVAEVAEDFPEEMHLHQGKMFVHTRITT